MLSRIYSARNTIPSIFKVGHDGFLATGVFTVSLCITRFENELPEERVSSLIKLCNPKRQRRIMSSKKTKACLRFFLDRGFGYEDLYRCVPIYPAILTIDTQKADALFRTLSNIGFSQKEITTLILKSPEVLRSNPSSVLKLYRYFEEELSMEKREFIELLLRRPAILSLLVEKNVVRTCQYFSKELKFDNESLKKMLVHYPRILASSVEKKLKPIVNYFLNDLSVPLHRLRMKLTQRPSILCSSVEGIKEKVHWMKDRLKFSDEEIFKSFSKELTIFYYSVPFMEKKINNLCTQLNCTTEDCKPVIFKMPQTLGLSEETLNAKIGYLTGELNRSTDEIVKYPTVLGLSLENRIKSRSQQMKEHQIPQEKFPLWRLFGVRDDKFQMFIERNKLQTNQNVVKFN